MNKKGFLTIIVIIAIFSIGIILILNNQVSNLEKDYSDNIIQTKNKITNYSISLNQVSQNCFNETDTSNCIDTNSDFIIETLNLDKEPYNCIKPNFNQQVTGEFLGRISCNYIIYYDEELYFSNEFYYDILVKEAN